MVENTAPAPPSSKSELKAGYTRSDETMVVVAAKQEAAASKRTRIPRFDHIAFARRTPVCVADLATSPFVSPRRLCHLRIAALLMHAIVVLTGLYTRREIFFIQLTNITNVLSLVFFASLTAISVRFLRAPRRKEDAEWIIHCASHHAGFCWALYSIVFAVMTIVVGVFWTLVLPEFDTSHGAVDWIYGVLAHGGTYACLVAELWLTRIPILRRFHTHLAVCLAVYLTFSVVLFFSTGYLIYAICDITKTINQILTPFLFLIGAFGLEIGVAMCSLREHCFGHLERRGLVHLSKKPLFGETVTYARRPSQISAEAAAAAAAAVEAEAEEPSPPELAADANARDDANE